LAVFVLDTGWSSPIDSPTMLPFRLWLNANIHTLDPDLPRAEVLVTAGSTILAVGDASLAEGWRSRVDEVIDLGGRTVVPGLTDSHIHLIEHGRALGEIALETCRSAAEAVAMVRSFPHPASGWIIGRGFQTNHFHDGVMPHRAMLDELFPSRPVMLSSRCGHQIWVNSAAMEAAGVTASTPDPEGGVIVRDERGEPTGVFQEEAIDLISRHQPDPSETALREAVRVAAQDLWSHGVTAVHAPEGRNHLGLVARMRQDDVLPIRTHYLPPVSMAEKLVAAAQCVGLGDRWLSLGGLKIFLDGALGSATALMHEDHCGRPGDRGVEVLPLDRFQEMVEHAHANRWRVAVHAIGDLAVDRAIDTIAASQRRWGISRDDRGPWDRIEHFQCLSPGAAERAGDARIAAMMQPIHLFDDWEPANRLWGDDRCSRTYACRSLWDAGVPIALGSDAPVASANPWLCMHAAVTRTDIAGEPDGGWHMPQALTASECLEAYCSSPARVAGELDWRGRLRPGSVADFAVLSENPLAEGCDLRGVQADMTILDGAVVHDRHGDFRESEC
jgi:predicted amidohydrolase YtcJ